jgi:hypothetical protein
MHDYEYCFLSLHRFNVILNNSVMIDKIDNHTYRKRKEGYSQPIQGIAQSMQKVYQQGG